MPSANGFDIHFEISDSEDEAEEIELEICEITEQDFNFKEETETSYVEMSRTEMVLELVIEMSYSFEKDNR